MCYIALLGPSRARLDVVRGRGSGAATSGPVAVEKLAALLVGALVCVRAKVVALGLEQIGGEPARTRARVLTHTHTHARTRTHTCTPSQTDARQHRAATTRLSQR